jgi:mannose-1-phosphate guanylyltransferase
MSDHVVILAGGSGTRFWPLSRTSRPKQFLSMEEGGASLIQNTYQRIKPILAENIGNTLWTVTHECQQELVKHHLPESVVIAEPCARNTAASVGLAAMHISRIDDSATMIVLPADHTVYDTNGLLQLLQQGVELAQNKQVLVTLGIEPKSPHTGYGYIRKGKSLNKDRSFQVTRFFEKPSLERAVDYLASGEFLWNSGMFVWTVKSILTAINEFLPATYKHLQDIGRYIGTPEYNEVLATVYPQIESTSIDFGILEHARNCAVIHGGDIGWNDIGSWDSWFDTVKSDNNGNKFKGDVVYLDAERCITHSTEKLAVVFGVSDLVVINVEDALLICPSDRLQDIKLIVEELKSKGRKELL